MEFLTWRFSDLQIGLAIDKEYNGLNKRKGQLCTVHVDGRIDILKFARVFLRE